MSHTPYAQTPDLRAQLDGIADSKWDDVLQQCLDAAADNIERVCNWGVPFVAGDTATSRMFPGSGDTAVFIDSFVSVSQVEARYSATDSWATQNAASYLPFSGDPKRPNFNKVPYSALMLVGSGLSVFPSSCLNKVAMPTLRVTARWGLGTEVPPSIRTAVIAQATLWFKRGQGGWANALANGDLGMLIFPKNVDPDIHRILDDGRMIRPSI